MQNILYLAYPDLHLLSSLWYSDHQRQFRDETQIFLIKDFSQSVLMFIWETNGFQGKAMNSARSYVDIT